MRTDTYGPGGFDPTKPNNNIIETVVVDEKAGTVTTTADGGEPTVEPMTPEAKQAAQETANQSAIETNLQSDLAAMQTIIDTPNATINSGPAPHIKAIARNLKRLNRAVLRDYTGTD